MLKLFKIDRIVWNTERRYQPLFPDEIPQELYPYFSNHFELQQESQEYLFQEIYTAQFFMVVAVNSMSMIKNGKVAIRQWPTILEFRKNKDSLGNALLIKLDSTCFYTGGSGEMLT